MSVERNRLRCLQVIDTLGMGGAETWLMEVLRLWARSGDVHMDFVLTSGLPGIFDEEAKALGANLYYLKFGRRSIIPFIKGFRRILYEGNYDAIHDHQDFASGWHFLAGAGCLPSMRFTHVHNSSYQILCNYGVTASRRLASRVGRRLVRVYASSILGTSRQVLEEYGFYSYKFNAMPVRALHCGFEPARFAGDPDEEARSVRDEFGWDHESKVVLFAGRIDQSPDPDDSRTYKNSGFAVSVAIEAARRDSHVHMILAGRTSSATPILEQQIADASLSSRIRFLGIRKDIGRLMLGSDLLLFPSRGEGLGMVAVEAQAAGLPVLMSTAVPMESIVLPELVTRLDLDAGSRSWVNSLLRMIETDRDVARSNQAVRNSPFSLEYSANALMKAYRGECES